LSDAQLEYLTSTDGIDHVAWGALELSAPDAPGFGVGRWIRLDADPGVAEFSLTVLDDWQGHGVGQLLLATLAVIAESLDVTVLRGYVGRENTRMVTWLRRLGATIQEDESDWIFDVPVPPDPTTSSSAQEFIALMDEIHVAVRKQRQGWDDEL
jgi:GNAT superfamily N-acetyltransferase